MEPRKKRTLILLVAFGCISILILAVLKMSKPTTTPVSSPAQTPEAVQSIIRQALDTRSESLCNSISDDAKKAYCNDNVLMVLASDKSDPGICGQILDKTTSAVCSDNFIITRAMNSRDPGACDVLADKNRVAQCRSDVQAFINNQKK
jgi:hypothetical protein